MKMKQMKFHLEGASPLLMHSDRLIDPLDPIVQKMKRITGKIKKTEDDLTELGKLEFLGGIYHNDEIGPYIPAVNVERMLRDGATMSRMGTKVRQGMSLMEDRVPLIYDGPRTLEELTHDMRFHHRTSVKVQKNRILRVRPWFRDWSASFTLLYDEKLFDAEQVRNIVTTCGDYIGLGDWRPRYGRFTSRVA